MSRYLCTFSGQYGDALWSLPTIRAISQIVGSKVDFAIMGQYGSLVSLIGKQSYIDRAFPVKDWLQVHNNHGAQPWNPPVQVEKPYDRVWHLGYRGHPGLNDVALPLIDYVAHQQGIKLRDPLPFIDGVGIDFGEQFKEQGFTVSVPRVTFAFNDQYKDRKEKFLKELRRQINPEEFLLVDVAGFDWPETAALIKNSIAFVGCRSANWVIAMGLNKKTITFEPHPARHMSGHLGRIFCCPYGVEEALPFNAPEEVAASIAKSILVNWRIQNESLANNRQESPTSA